MEANSENIIQQLSNLRQLFADALPTDSKTINDYAWIIAKALNREHERLGSIRCRQFLADYLKLPTERPSRLHSAILSAAIKVAEKHADFRFASFLKLWGIEKLRPEDYERQHAQDGKSFPSLAERTARTLGHSLLLHPERTTNAEEASSAMDQFLSSFGLHISTMIVTRIKEAKGKDGRKYLFVTVTSPEGLEIETISHNLQPSPLQPLPEGKRHYVNIGQLYDVLFYQKQGNVTVPNDSSLVIKAAYLSPKKAQDYFPTAIGYIEAVDSAHGHMHIYDKHSRHFVAPIQRFTKEVAGDFVRFIPIIPAASKFKTAIIQVAVPSDSTEVQSILRDVRIFHIDEKRGFASWVINDSDEPLTELLSPIQLSEGMQSPVFRQGYISLASPLLTAPLEIGTTLRVLVYLRRSKGGAKHPHIARIF